MGDYCQLPTKLNFLSSNFFSVRNRCNMVFAIGSNSDSTAAYRLCIFREITGSPRTYLHLKSGNSITAVPVS